MLSPLLNKCSTLSSRNGLTLYKQLLRTILDYACPAWVHRLNMHTRRMQIFQSRCLSIIGDVVRYVQNVTLHRNLLMPTIKDYFRKLVQSFYDRLSGATNPLIQDLGNYFIDPGRNFVKCDNPSRHRLNPPSPTLHCSIGHGRPPAVPVNQSSATADCGDKTSLSSTLLCRTRSRFVPPHTTAR
uniref:(California timema) hypothetical protein n=1 Tax=Timema californicum TaxID=61474 RepID=A0A7R9P5I9_TIMCA|nr:unnamed protein product [Timema californicum]